MSRQPFLPTHEARKGDWSLNSIWTVKYPDLTSLIMSGIAAWSYVELELAVFLSTLLGADAPPTLAVFTVVRRFSNSKDIVHAAAEATLGADDLKLIDALLSVVKTASNARDDLAHGLWGTCNGIDDGLIWLEAKYAAPWASRLRARKPGPDDPAIHEAVLPHLFVYKRDDLLEAQRLIEGTWELIARTVVLLRMTGHARAGIYAQLCREPHIREALARQNAGGSS